MSDDNSNLLEELLEADNDGIVTDQKTLSENVILEPLLEEINLVQETTVRLFVRAILLNCPPVFWTAPSSISGKHHPPDEHGVGGNVIHTKKVTRIVDLICKAQERSSFEKDLVLAAAILHDITKYVVYDDEPKYDPMHPYTVDALVNGIQEKQSNNLKEAGSLSIFLEDEYVHQILRLIHCHLGIWSPIYETFPIVSLEWTLHLADLIASRLHEVTDGLA